MFSDSSCFVPLVGICKEPEEKLGLLADDFN